MNYKKIYDDLIESRLKLNREKSKDNYFERHHIIPKCVGGTDDANNFIILTAREHFIAHYLLTKIYKDCNKMKYAFNMMNSSSKNQNRYFNSRLFENNKNLVVKIISERMSSIRGENHPNFGKKQRESTREKIRFWHRNMADDEKIERKKIISEKTKEAMDSFSELEKSNMIFNQIHKQFGFHFIMVADKNGNEFLFKKRKGDFKDFIKNNNYSNDFYTYPYGEKYIPKDYYHKNTSKAYIEKDKNSEGLIQYKMERVVI